MDLGNYVRVYSERLAAATAACEAIKLARTLLDFAAVGAESSKRMSHLMTEFENEANYAIGKIIMEVLPYLEGREKAVSFADTVVLRSEDRFRELLSRMVRIRVDRRCDFCGTDLSPGVDRLVPIVGAHKCVVSMAKACSGCYDSVSKVVLSEFMTRQGGER